MRVGIVGCGLMGQRRAANLAGARLIHCVDTDAARARALAAGAAGCTFGTDWQQMLALPQIEAIIVATPPDVQAQITRAAIQAGKHVLVEKPAARRAGELHELISLAEAAGVRVRVGFNHRHHRAFRQARQLVDSGVLGPLLFVRAR